MQPFVGRQQEIEALMAAIDRPQGQVLLIAGDPGTGKSALLSELRRRLAYAPSQFCRYAWFSRLTSTDTVSAKLFELMDDLLHIDDLTRGRLVWGVPEEGQKWREFLKGVPAIGQLLSALVRDDHRPVRSRFLETLAAVANRLEQDQRLVLLFDPEKYLHGDYAAEWLNIAQGLPDRVTAVFAQRPDDALMASDDLVVLPKVHRIPSQSLGFLGRSESDEFLREFVKAEPQLAYLVAPAKESELRAIQAVFWERYQGYPLVMRIVVDELGADPVNPLQTLRQLPSRLTDLMQRQYNNVRDKVGADGLHLLKVLAVQPVPVRIDVLSSVLSRDSNLIEQLSARREIRILLRIEAHRALSLYHSIFEEFVQSQMDRNELTNYYRRSFNAYFNAHEANPNNNDVLIAAAYHLEQTDLRTDRPGQYAKREDEIGVALYDLPHVNRAKNLWRAIRCFEEALTIWTRKAFPEKWANTQNNLGTAYANLPTGDQSANLQEAIACYAAALGVYTEREFPRDWAMIQNNLGTAYANLPTGDQSANLQQAIACYEAALRVYTEDEFPVDWARTQHNLGLAYPNLPTGDRGENLHRAISYFDAALRVYTERDFPRDWAITQSNLGTAYADLHTDDQSANLHRAIAYFEAALRGYKAAGLTEEANQVTQLLALAREQ